MNSNIMILIGETAYNSVFAVRSAHSNAFGTSQTRKTLSEIAPYIKINFYPQNQLIKDMVVKMNKIKIIVEKHPEGYVAYPLGLKGVVVGEGDTYEEALGDVKSAINFHIETFGAEVAV